MERTLSLRKRIVAALLAVVMVMGFWVMGASAANADPTAEQDGVGIKPTGEEYVYNPEDSYITPQGGLFRFVGVGFVPDSTIFVRIQLGINGVVLGTFETNGDGEVVAAIAGEEYPALIIPDWITVDTYDLVFYYEDTIPVVIPFDPPDYPQPQLAIIKNIYSAHMWIEYEVGQHRQLEIESDVSNYAPGQEIFVKIDYKDSPTLSNDIYVQTDGSFSGSIILPDYLIDTGNHTFTILTGEATVDGVFYPRLSLSKNLTV